MKHAVWVLFLAAALLAPACTGKEDPPRSKLATVNGYAITEQAFRRHLAEREALHGPEVLSDKQKKRILSEAIERELLIQEAVRLGLEREKQFRESIERYWEQTLISSIIKRKVAELGGHVLVSEKDLAESYQELKKQGGECPPFEEIKNELARQVREQKKQQAINDWLAGIRKKAAINIDQKALAQVK